jgi:hypothetical protein
MEICSANRTRNTVVAEVQNIRGMNSFISLRPYAFMAESIHFTLNRNSGCILKWGPTEQYS